MVLRSDLRMLLLQPCLMIKARREQHSLMPSSFMVLRLLLGWCMTRVLLSHWLPLLALLLSSALVISSKMGKTFVVCTLLNVMCPLVLECICTLQPKPLCSLGGYAFAWATRWDNSQISLDPSTGCGKELCF